MVALPYRAPLSGARWAMSIAAAAKGGRVEENLDRMNRINKMRERGYGTFHA